MSRPDLSHCVVALAIMALVCPALWYWRVRAYAWHAAAAVCLFFYTREAAQAERALKPVIGDPTAFFYTLWPGNWIAGGAHLSEWLLPSFAAIVVACVLPADPERGRRPRPDEARKPPGPDGPGPS